MIRDQNDTCLLLSLSIHKARSNHTSLAKASAIPSNGLESAQPRLVLCDLLVLGRHMLRLLIHSLGAAAALPHRRNQREVVPKAAPVSGTKPTVKSSSKPASSRGLEDLDSTDVNLSSKCMFSKL